MVKSGPPCAPSELTFPGRISSMLHLPYSPPVPVLQQPPRAPSELPEKQEQAAPACPTDPEGPGLIKALGLHGSAECTVLWGLSEPSWEGSGSTSALGFHIANSSRGPIFFPGALPPCSGVCTFRRYHTRSVFRTIVAMWGSVSNSLR